MKKLLLLSTLAVVACSPSDNPDLQARATKLAQQLLIVDTHVDVPYRVEEAAMENKTIDVGEHT